MKLPPKRKVYDFLHYSAVGVLASVSFVMAFGFFRDTVKITYGAIKNKPVQNKPDENVVTYEEYKKDIAAKEQVEFEKQLLDRQKEAELKLSS